MVHNWQFILYLAGVIALFLAAFRVVTAFVSLALLGAALLALGFVLPVLAK